MYVCMHHGGFVAGLENGMLDVGVHHIQHLGLGGHEAKACMYVCMYIGYYDNTLSVCMANRFGGLRLCPRIYDR